MLVGRAGGHGAAELCGWAADEDGHLQLEVHEAAGPEDRVRIFHRLGLTPWSPDGGSGHHHRGSTSMVTHRQVLPTEKVECNFYVRGAQARKVRVKAVRI